MIIGQNRGTIIIRGCKGGKGQKVSMEIQLFNAITIKLSRFKGEFALCNSEYRSSIYKASL